MQKLNELIAPLESRIAHHQLIVPEISKASVGWHIEHSLLVMDQVTNSLKASDPQRYKSKFNIRRIVLMTTGNIPRGRIQSPRTVRPTIQLNEETLREHLQRTSEGVASLSAIQPGHFFTHPFLGDFKLKPALKFMRLHTGHHLKIIDDIVKAS